jgi:hypothetical protein
MGENRFKFFLEIRIRKIIQRPDYNNLKRE